MQIKTKNPWESSFENLTASTAKPIKKAVTEVVKITAEDVRKQLFGEKPPEEVPTEEQQKIKVEEAKKAAEMKGRVAKMEEEIKKIREARLQKEKQVEQVKKTEKAQAEQKKKEMPIWQKAMNMGAQAERRVNAGG